VIGNGLDENLWWSPPALDRPDGPALRLLYMGTATHAADLDAILAALAQLADRFPGRVAIDVIGVTAGALPSGFHRVDPPLVATQAYPAFVNWLSARNDWHLGLAPLADTAFNRGKSGIKAMDYAALGLPTVASDIGIYDGVVRAGESGLLVENTEIAWFEALSGLLRDPARRQRMAQAARADFKSRFTLGAQALARRRALLGT
jgi:glycosyltransferase involved in cell wall biosynthesis